MADDSVTHRSMEALAQQAYDLLRRRAKRLLRLEHRFHTLQPTDLVHEAFIKLTRSPQADAWQGMTHFQSVAANAMRQILVDHARNRRAQKRGGAWIRVTLGPDMALGIRSDVDVLALDEALNALASLDPRKGRVVELRYFGGMTCKEIAELLDISPKTVEADWYFARAWLRNKMSESEG